MIAHTKLQIIANNGVPAFVVIPYSEFIREFPEVRLPSGPRIPKGDSVPHRVVENVIRHGYSPIRAWREYLDMTQAEVAQKADITQAALSQMESEKKRPRKATREKIAKALGVSIVQLDVS